MNRPEMDALDQALAHLYQDGPSPRFEKNWREAVRGEEQTQMKNIWKKVVLPIAAALVLVLGASWAGQLEGGESAAWQIREERGSKAGNETAMYSAAPSALMNSASSGSSSSSRSAKDYVMEEAAYDMGEADTVAGASDGAAIPEPVDSRKLIRTVDLSLRTETFQQDVEGIQQLLLRYGGYIENLYQQGEADSRYGRSASLTMRVPSQHLDAFVEGVSGYGRVTSRSETTEDMTEQYTDNEMRIQTLRTKMDRLNTLLGQAENVSDIIQIESEIADTQYDLERLEGRQLNIDRRVDMSTVYVNVQEAIAQEDVEDEELTLGQRLKAAFRASIEGLNRFGRNLLVFLVMAAPVIVPVAVIVVIIMLVRRSRRKKTHQLLADASESNEEENQ